MAADRKTAKISKRASAPHRPRERLAQVDLGSRTLTKKGVAARDWTDPYRLAVGLSWPRFLGALLGLYLSVNCLFALLYFIRPGSVANAHAGSLADLFFFSLETLATVGYGEMYPDDLYGHCVAAAEILCGVAFTAILTGLIFVRFSRPRAKFLFADNPVVTTHNGKPHFMLRVGNGRASAMGEAHIKISVLLTELSAEGVRFRRTHLLHLVRDTLPVFPLTWTVMHAIDEASPLFGLDPAEFGASEAQLFVSLEARDPALAAAVQDLRTYDAGDIRFGMRYADIISTDENGHSIADMPHISDIEPGVGL